MESMCSCDVPGLLNLTLFKRTECSAVKLTVPVLLCRSRRVPGSKGSPWAPWQQQPAAPFCFLCQPRGLHPLLQQCPPLPPGHLQRPEPLQHRDRQVHLPGVWRLPVSVLLHSVPERGQRATEAKRVSGDDRLLLLCGRSDQLLRGHCGAAGAGGSGVA